MKNLTPDFILNGTKNAQKNTWGGRYNKITPAIRMFGSNMVLSTSIDRVEINAFDEIILTIIMKFLFAPIWLIKQWYDGSLGMVGNESYVDEMIENWINIGIVWKESDVTGQYLRPTYALFQLFDVPPYKYCNIPFNTLRHTISEEQMMFEVMSGTSQICKREKTTKRISELGFTGELQGTNIISEEDFRNPFQTYQQIMDVENKIEKEIKAEAKITEELRDFRNFSIVKKVGNTGEIKDDFKFHVPDLIIPVPRDKGKPMSIAIEVELSNKRAINYVETMNRYRDNNRFAVVYWFCSSMTTATAIRDAYIESGGTGTCRTELMEWVLPSPKY